MDSSQDSGRKRLLIVDGDKYVRDATRRAFEREFEIFEAPHKEEALRQIELNHPDVIFLEPLLNGIPSGWEVLKEIREKGKKVVVLIITILLRAKEHPLAKQADGVLEKPLTRDILDRFLIEKGVLSPGK